MLEALGGTRERIRAARADRFALDDIDPLNVVAIEVEASRGARILPLTAGLADDLFEHDGQITKREIRALTLSALAPRRGELLWDIGAGAGSIAIEWMLADPVAARHRHREPIRSAPRASGATPAPRRAGPDRRRRRGARRAGRPAAPGRDLHRRRRQR